MNNKFDVLFTENTAHVAVIDERLCPSGILALAYPEETYGYHAQLEITEEDIPLLVEELRERGFRPTERPFFNSDGSVREPTATHFMYSLRGAKWWDEFPHRVEMVVDNHVTPGTRWYDRGLGQYVFDPDEK